MISIKNNVFSDYTIKKSKFICFLFKVDSLDLVNFYLNDLRNKYSDATHICYGYIIDNVKRFNDDGEPSKTAGMPILNVLESKDLNHVLCCVVRYFGGIKLGANGLVRAYTNSVSSTLELAQIVKLEKGTMFTIDFDYNYTRIIDNIIQKFVINKSYNDRVSYQIKINNNELGRLNEIKDFATINKIGECYIEIEKLDN